MSDCNSFGISTLLKKADRIALSETQSVERKLEDLAHQIDNASINSLMHILLFLVAIYWFFPFFSRKLKRRHDRRLSIRRFTQVPCRNCQFLANNQYLKCAVHPSKVLTAQAVNCLDYCCKHKSC